jgi:hypothetical protein
MLSIGLQIILSILKCGNLVIIGSAKCKDGYIVNNLVALFSIEHYLISNTERDTLIFFYSPN